SGATGVVPSLVRRSCRHRRSSTAPRPCCGPDTIGGSGVLQPYTETVVGYLCWVRAYMPGMEEVYWLARQGPPAIKLLLFHRSTRRCLARLGCGPTGCADRTPPPLRERSVSRSSSRFHPWQIAHAPSARLGRAWSPICLASRVHARSWLWPPGWPPRTT